MGAQLTDPKGLATQMQTQDRIVFILCLMILKVIFQPGERSTKGAWLALPGLACACCGQADGSPAAVWFGGSCIALDFSVGAVLVTPR